MEYIARKKVARRFYVKVASGDGDVLAIEASAPKKQTGDYGWNSREEILDWTLRDLVVAVRLWLSGTADDAKALWRVAEEVGVVDEKLPVLGGSDLPFAEWQDAIVASQREAFRHNVIPDAWGERVKAAKAIHVLSTHRDADHITNSNFDTAVEWFEGLGESARVAQWDTANYSHWAVGDVDYLFVAVDSDAARLAQYIHDKLEGYPILDDDDVSQRGSDAAWEWMEHDAEDLLAYSRDATLKVEMANALDEGVEYDIYGDGNDTMSYRVSVHEMCERFGLEMDEDDVERVRRMAYGQYAKEPMPIRKWERDNETTLDAWMTKERRAMKKRPAHLRMPLSSRTRKGVRLVSIGYNNFFIVRNGLVYEVDGRYEAQDTWERLIALNAEKQPSTR